MKVALDTNRYVDLCKGIVETVTLLEEAEDVVLPFVVLGELRPALPSDAARSRTSARCDVSS